MAQKVLLSNNHYTSLNPSFFYGINGESVGFVIEEADCIFRTAGTLSDAAVRVSANDRNGEHRVRLIKNGSASDIVLTIPAATTGLFKSESTVAVEVGDKFHWRPEQDGSSGSVSIRTLNLAYQSSGDTTMFPFFSVRSATHTGNNRYSYWHPLHQNNSNYTATPALTVPVATVINNFQVFIQTDSRATTKRFVSFINGVQANLNLLITTGTTGVFESTDFTDTLEAGDTYYVRTESNAASGNLIMRGRKLEFHTDPADGYLIGCYTDDPTGANLPQTIAYNAMCCGRLLFNADEAVKKQDINVGTTLSHLQAFVFINSANTGTIRLRINGANATQVVAIGTGGATGLFVDNENSDEVFVDDEVTVSWIKTDSTELRVGYIAFLANDSSAGGGGNGKTIFGDEGFMVRG